MTVAVSQASSLEYLREGFRLLWHPELRGYVVIPLLINTLVFGGLFWFSLHAIGLAIQAAVDWLPDWLDWLRWVMWPVSVLLVSVVVMYAFSTLANLLAAPFNGLLAEKAEELLTGQSVNSKETLWVAIKQVPRIFMKELHKLGFQIKWVVLLLIISLVPGVNLLAPLLWFCFSAWMTALEYCDYPMDNHQFSFPQVREEAAQHRWPCFSFGAVVMAGNMVPVLNLLMMPAAVCGATLLWVERMRD
ncbi:MAG: sulfate transporter CysZ [Cellvibrionales bacterium]|nr:sulfate transporter CysZ [Cellvibrionales bacterium]